MFKRVLFFTMITFLFTACIKQPDIPKYTIERGDKIGYIVKAKQYPMHTHIGTTVFNNFSKTYNYDWHIENYMSEKLTSKLSTLKNIELVNLSEKSYSLEDVNNLIIAEDDKWIVNPEKKEIFEKLKKENLKAVVIIYDAPKSAILECGTMGCTSFDAKGYGLFTRSLFGMDNYFAATSFYVDTYLFSPISSLNKKYQTINGAQMMPLISGTFTNKEHDSKYNFTAPKDFDNWTEEEMLPFKKAIEQYIDSIVIEIQNVLAQ